MQKFELENSRGSAEILGFWEKPTFTILLPVRFLQAAKWWCKRTHCQLNRTGSHSEVQNYWTCIVVSARQSCILHQTKTSFLCVKFNVFMRMRSFYLWFDPGSWQQIPKLVKLWHKSVFLFFVSCNSAKFGGQCAVIDQTRKKLLEYWRRILCEHDSLWRFSGSSISFTQILNFIYPDPLSVNDITSCLATKYIAHHTHTSLQLATTTREWKSAFNNLLVIRVTWNGKSSIVLVWKHHGCSNFCF